jgi:hypothetical protein
MQHIITVAHILYFILKNNLIKFNFILIFTENNHDVSSEDFLVFFSSQLLICNFLGFLFKLILLMCPSQFILVFLFSVFYFFVSFFVHSLIIIQFNYLEINYPGKILLEVLNEGG